MGKQKAYKITIFTGDLNSDNLTAEIFTSNGIYITSVTANGNDVMLDFTCETIDEICRGKKGIL